METGTERRIGNVKCEICKRSWQLKRRPAKHEAELKRRDETQEQLERRLTQAEKMMQERGTAAIPYYWRDCSVPKRNWRTETPPKVATMIVFVHSLGSIWHARAYVFGANSVWNTTGIDDGKRIRPRSQTYGQVALGRRLRLELHKHGSIRRGLWIASKLTEYAGSRKLQLIVRAPADSAADFYLVTITDTLIGLLSEDGWDPRETQIGSTLDGMTARKSCCSYVLSAG